MAQETNGTTNIEIELFDKTIRSLPISVLKVDTYQKELNERTVKIIVEQFNPNAIGVITVSFRDGVYWIVDGQHRVKVLELLGHERIRCDVYRGLTKKQESDLFYQLNFIKTRQMARDKINSLIEGTDPHYLPLLKIINEEGFTFNLKSKEDKGRGLVYVSAVDTIRESFDRLDQDKFRRLLRLIKRTWKGNKKSVSSVMLKAVRMIINLYEDDFTDDEFVKRLCGHEPSEILRDGYIHKGAQGTVISTAKCIRELYNKGPEESQLSNKFSG